MKFVGRHDCCLALLANPLNLMSVFLPSRESKIAPNQHNDPVKRNLQNQQVDYHYYYYYYYIMGRFGWSPISPLHAELQRL